MGIKYRVNEKFFNTWGREMAYTLGYLYADGSLEDASYLRGKYVRVTSVEQHNILKLKKWLGSRHTVVAMKPSWPNGKTCYQLRIGSHKLYDRLIALGLYPNKSLTIKFPRIPRAYLNYFILGYFDGDGCVYLYTTKGEKQKRIVKKLSVIFTSGSRDFLYGLQSILRERIGLRREKIYRSQRAFQLRLDTGDSIRIFKFLYRNVDHGIFLKRKLCVFLKYFTLRPIRVDADIEKILKKYGHVVK